MEGPSLILVPPTPVGYKDPSPSTSASSSPDLSQPEKERGSSETTIFTIYSMYEGVKPGDEASKVAVTDFGPTLSNVRDGKNGNHVYQQPNPSTNSDVVYDGNSSDGNGHASSKYMSATDLPARESVISNGSVHLSYLDERPLSAHISSSGIRNNAPKSSDTFRLSKYKDLPPPPDNPNRGSYLPTGTEMLRDFHLPQPIHPRSETLSRRSVARNTGSPIPPVQGIPTPPRTWTPDLLSPPQPTLSPSPRGSSLKIASPGSKISLVPSEGEEVDAFYVRNTYAELEMTGVKGDGYEEGVERTRARTSGSRSSMLREEQALGDGNEKTRELSRKELETLESLDRYGFFTITSHDRLIQLSSSPLAKRLSRVPPGPKNAPTNATALPNLPPTPRPSKEASRIAKWNRMLEPHIRDGGGNIEAWGIKSSKQRKLRERAYKGIPDRWRSATWELLLCRFSGTGKPELLELRQEYRNALDKPSTYDIQIDLDVPRTISGHIMFRTRYGSGQRSLFHVLHSFSLRCSECGYVQGMGPIAATLLCYFEPERVYASLVRLHDAYAMHSIFSPGFPGLLEAIYVQERITEQTMPDVYSAFKDHMVSTTSYATKWYITLFANSVPFQTQLRLWDIFLLEGQDVFVAVAVAIVWVYRDNITSGTANFETVLSLLSSFFVPQDEDALLSWIEKMLGDKKLRSSMVRWREEWRHLVATGKDGTVLL